MPGESPFAGDWRDCLSAHYTYTVRAEDHITERTLVDVLREVGFSDNEVRELRVVASMRVEDMGENFVPDLDILAEDASADGEQSFMIAVPDVASTQQDSGSGIIHYAQPDDNLFESSAELYLPQEALAAFSEDDLLSGDDNELVETEDTTDDTPSPAPDSPVQLSLF